MTRLGRGRRVGAPGLQDEGALQTCRPGALTRLLNLKQLPWRRGSLFSFDRIKGDAMLACLLPSIHPSTRQTRLDFSLRDVPFSQHSLVPNIDKQPVFGLETAAFGDNGQRTERTGGALNPLTTN